ncbi:MAG: aldo/keto reductase [Candidatus Aminicenantes bacterium]|nr:aldo/keto reductase [Candidatus Aminicenantes bacterium]
MKNKKGEEEHVLSRRHFIGGSIATAACAGLQASRFLPGQGYPSENNESGIREFRVLGRTGFKVSDIAFGSAELTDSSLLEAILDTGINYIDSSEVYGNGNSERIIGSVIKKRDRKNLFLTTKIKVRERDTKTTLLGRAEKCLERLQTGYIDCLMYHGPSKGEDLKNEAFHQAVAELRSRGRVRYCGVSCHGAQWGDVPVTMEQILQNAAADGRFDVMILVYNFLQREQGEKVLEACRFHNVGATLMKTNPVLNYLERQEEADAASENGSEIPDSRKATLEHLRKRASGAEAFKREYNLFDYDAVRSAAIRFVLRNPHVGSVCTTIKNFSDLEFYTRLSGGRLDTASKLSLARYEKTRGRLYCRHACGECESVCPVNVPVNTIMRYNHYFRAQGREKTAIVKYAAIPGNRNAKACMACRGKCEMACPHGVPIREQLIAAHERLLLA